MTVHVSDHTAQNVPGDQLAPRIRPYLLALKQLEQVYILARWIRNLFMDMISRRSKQVGTVNRPVVANESSVGLDMQGNHRHSQPRSTSSTSPPTHMFARPPSATSYPATSSYTVDSPPAMTRHTAPQRYPPHMYAAGVESGFMLGDFMPYFSAGNTFDPRFSNGADVLDFPPPGTVEYQTLHFLADLGLPGSHGA